MPNEVSWSRKNGTTLLTNLEFTKNPWLTMINILAPYWCPFKWVWPVDVIFSDMAGHRQVTLAHPLSESFLPYSPHIQKIIWGNWGPQDSPNETHRWPTPWLVVHGFLPQTPIHIVPICNFWGLSGEDHMVWLVWVYPEICWLIIMFPIKWLVGGLEHLDYFSTYWE